MDNTKKKIHIKRETKTKAKHTININTFFLDMGSDHQLDTLGLSLCSCASRLAMRIMLLLDTLTFE